MRSVEGKNTPTLEVEIPFWNRLTEKQKEFLAKQILVKKYEKGSSIYNCKDACTGVLFLRKGQIRVYMVSEDGREVTLYRLYQGDTCTLSATCILKEITFDVFIEVVEDSEILSVNAATFLSLSKENLYVENFLYKQTVERFSDVMWAFQQIVFTSMDKRLAQFLVDESNNTEQNVIFMTHEEIAKYLGSAREVISRMLKYFAEDGLVRLSRGKIEILDKKRLTNLHFSS